MVHRFGAVEIDGERHEVRVDGAPRPVEPQVLAVLSYLIEHRARVVSKEELLDEVWGSRFVSAAAVTSRIKSARKAIGDSGREQRLIRTVHGRGYRFVAELDDDGAGPDGRPEHGSSGPGETSGPGPSTAPMRSTADGWPLTGRDDELAAAVAAAMRGTSGGVVFTGPAGVGKTRLARAVIESVATDDGPVAFVSGHSSATRVPLAALAHLLPADIADAAGLQGEMGRAVLFQRARTAITERSGGRRLVVMVDDVERVDQLSLALMASLIADDVVHAVMTQRTDGSEPIAVDDLVRSGAIAQVRLGPVPVDQLKALLVRVLDGPVQPQSAETLVSACDGNPGLLRQLVEASLASGVLIQRSDVWRLAGRPSAPGDLALAMRARLEPLGSEQRDGLELVALAGDLDLDLAFELVDEEVLDELELEGMISVTSDGPRPRVELAHPLYGEILIGALPPLRDRRHRERLEKALAGSVAASAADRLQLVRLQLESGNPIDEDMLLESATLAFLEGHTGLTLKLLRQVPDDRHTVHHEVLLGEALYQRGRFDEAGATWTAIDLDGLESETAALVVRRRATWLFHARWRHDEAISYLRTQIDRFEGEERLSLESYWTELAGVDGRFSDEVIERVERSLPDSDDQARAEYLGSAAMARFLRGENRIALELLEECERVSGALVPSLTWQGAGFAKFVEVSLLPELGHTERAWTVLQRHIGAGASPSFGYLAIAAGRLALLSGHHQQVLDWLDPYIGLADALGISTYGRSMQVSAALAALELGDDERAVADAAAMRADLPDAMNLTGLDLRWSLLQIEAATGDRAAAAIEMLDAANDARASLNRHVEGLMLLAAVHAGAATRAIDRLGELADEVDGPVAPLRWRAARAVLGDDDPESVASELDRLGRHWDASVLRRTVR